MIEWRLPRRPLATRPVFPACYGFWKALTGRYTSLTRLWEDPRETARGSFSLRRPFRLETPRFEGGVGTARRSVDAVRGAEPASAMSPTRHDRTTSRSPLVVERPSWLSIVVAGHVECRACGRRWT